MDPGINSDIISHFSFNITHCTKGCFMAKAKSSKPASPAAYGNDSISQLQGADRVRLRPGVIFGSDGLDGCEHAVFEILSNSIDEAREGYGDLIRGLRRPDHPDLLPGQEHRGRGLRPRLSAGLEQPGAALELGAGLLRALRRRQVPKQRRRRLRLRPGPERAGRLRHAVRLPLHGRDGAP